MIQEARAYRKHGVFADRSREDRIEELEAQVASLEGELKWERLKRGGRIEVDDFAFLERYLEGSYQTLPELLQEIVESSALDGLIRERIEHELYVLAGQDKIEYERDSGWKLAGGSESE